MKANRRRDTKPETAVRSVLHGRGLRFRVDLPIRPDEGRPIRPDLVFTAAHVAVFIDGCFWHGCPLHGTKPATNSDYWLPKLEANQRRDKSNTQRLEAAGWTVIRAWAHEDPPEVALRVETALSEARSV
jgi:DNA mismatch endonuclease (patch repair protein)